MLKDKNRDSKSKEQTINLILSNFLLINNSLMLKKNNGTKIIRDTNLNVFTVGLNCCITRGPDKSYWLTNGREIKG